MSWLFGGKKEKKEEKGRLPELPELPPLETDFQRKNFLSHPPIEKPQIKNELPALPSFPLSSTGQKINNEIVKHAIREPPIETEERFLTREIEEPIFPRTVEQSQEKATPSQTFPIKKEKEPVFVRIDKYQTSLADLQEAKKKILEIESALREIKEIKKREDIELQAWTAKIENAKTRLDSIDKIIFQKLE
ncbi:MAG: hypothetical protein ABIG37_01120 [Nanoarchaeota archaeon]